MPRPTAASPRRSGEPVGLPRFAFDPRARGAKYVDLTTGRFVAQERIESLLRDFTRGGEGRLELYAMQYANGNMSGRQFYELMTREVKLLTNANTALARGGWGAVTQADWGYNGFMMRKEYESIRQLIADKEAGLISEAQLIQRARLHANTAFGRYWEIETARQAAAGNTAERVITVGDDRVCPECLGAEAARWQPIGTFTVPLHPGCRCSKEYQSAAGGSA